MGLINLSRGDIITDALDIAGRPDLVSQARLWLNLYLEEIYYNQDMYWTLKSTSLSVANGLSFPSDYRSAKSAQIVDSNNSRADIEIIDDSAHWQNLKKAFATTESGMPQYALADELNRQFQFLPSPRSGLTLDLSYYSVPSLPDHTDAATDLLVPVWKMPTQILIDKIKVKAMEYNDDDRFDKAEQKQEQTFAMAKMNNHDRRGGPSRLQMGKRFKKRF